MSNYTTELRWWAEQETGLSGKSAREIITAAAPLLFDFYYPYWSTNPNEKVLFQQRVLRHYYTREIGVETIGLFKLKLEDKMGEIMPYFNKLYAAAAREFNYLTTDESTENENEVTTGHTDNTNTTENKGNSKNKYSDTPQGAITGLETDEYLTSAEINENALTTTTNGNADANGSRKTERTYVGRKGASGGKLLADYYQAQLNIDKMLYKELDVLFMSIW